jgi:TonB family protein
VSSVPNTTSPDAEHGNPSSECSARSNAIALEVEVSVTGARADAAARELFTEETKTVLVFRDGAVIRLSATVAPGQLLFVTDKKSSAEVVCQVLNTRPCNETSRYVDVQFTEEKPTFWDVAFPTGSKVAPEFSVKQHLEAEAQTTGAPTAAVEPHKAEDVDQLRKEVEALRKQLLELSQKTAAPPLSQDNVLASSPADVPPNDASPTKLDESRDAAWIKALTETPQVTPTPEAPLMPAAGETEKQQAPRPVIGMSLPIRVAGEGVPASEPANRSKNESADPSEALLPTPSLDFSKIPSSSPYVPTGYGLLRRPSTWTPQRLIALGVFLVVTLTASLWIGKPWRYFLSKKSVDVSAPSNPANSVSTASAVAPPVSTGAATVVKTSAKPHESKNISEAPANTASHSAKNDASGDNESSAAGGTERQSSKKPLAVATGKARTKVTAPETTTTAADTNPASEPVIPPKLLRAATPVYPPDAMLNFVTGDVRAEALVGTDGQVTEVHVLSGPKAFHEAAIDALKHYEYAPATQGGKPVPSKVTVTVKFWFDP